MKTISVSMLAFGVLALAGCKTSGAGDAVQSAGSSVGQAASSAIGSGIPSLVNVDLRNVLNNLALDLHLDRANVPINAQIPITLAANICGVNINILSASTGGSANCTATTSWPELAQVVQQQMAAGGGGAQGGSTATNGTAGGTAATGTSGATGTGGTSTGTATGTGTTTAPATTTTTTPPRQ